MEQFLNICRSLWTAIINNLGDLRNNVQHPETSIVDVGDKGRPSVFALDANRRIAGESNVMSDSTTVLDDDPGDARTTGADVISLFDRKTDGHLVLDVLFGGDSGARGLAAA